MADRLDALCGIKSRDGDKTYWTKVGVAFPNRKGGGYTLFLDYVPMRRDDEGRVAILLAEPRERDEAPRRRGRDDDDDRAPRGGGKKDDMDDDIPFLWAGLVPWIAALVGVGGFVA